MLNRIVQNKWVELGAGLILLFSALAELFIEALGFGAAHGLAVYALMRSLKPVHEIVEGMREVLGEGG